MSDHGCPGKAVSVSEYLRRIPKVELHAHLNGCIRHETLMDLAHERGATLSNRHFSAEPLHENLASPPNNGEHHSMYNIMPRSLQNCFDMFAEIPACVNDLSALRRITQEALEDFAAHHVAYLELRSTPKRLLRSHQDDQSQKVDKQVYIETVLEGIRDFQSKEKERFSHDPVLSSSRLPIVCNFIVAIDRSQSLEEATDTVHIAIDMFQRQQSRPSNLSPSIVGIDLGGNPTKNDFRTFQTLFQKARQAGLKVTIHCGEIPCAEDDNSKHERRVATESKRKARDEAVAILAFRPDRLGHALLLPSSLQKVLEDTKIPVETCPTSNVMTLELARSSNGNLVHGLSQHPCLAQWLQNNHPLSIGTDDPGVFHTNATKELVLLVNTFSLDPCAMAEKVADSVNYAFCNETLRQEINAKMREIMKEIHHSP
jgi:adenosine deaminase